MQKYFSSRLGSEEFYSNQYFTYKYKNNTIFAFACKYVVYWCQKIDWSFILKHYHLNRSRNIIIGLECSLHVSFWVDNRAVMLSLKWILHCTILPLKLVLSWFIERIIKLLRVGPASLDSDQQWMIVAELWRVAKYWTMDGMLEVSKYIHFTSLFISDINREIYFYMFFMCSKYIIQNWLVDFLFPGVFRRWL